jgi:hypothetical protein
MGFITSPSEDPLRKAIQAGGELADANPRDIDEVVIVLTNYHFFLSSEMGRIYAALIATNSEMMRAKLNMIKPVVEAVKVKIDALKKIYDRKIRELQNNKRVGE